MVPPATLRKTLTYALLMTICAGLFAPARAQEAQTTPPPLAPFTLEALYEFTWTGIPFGKLRLEAKESLDEYQISANVKLTGLLSMFVKHSSQTSVSGSARDFIKGPRTYESNYKTRNKPRRIKMFYDQNGHIGEHIIEPAENRAKRPEVPSAQKDRSLDPLTLMPQLRRRLAEALSKGEKEFQYPVFDGRRLMQTTYRIEGKQTLRIGGKKVPTTKIVVTRRPIAGYSKGELDDFQKGDPALMMFFSDLPELMPVKLRADIAVGALEATRVR